MSIPAPNLLAKAQKSLKVLENAFLNGNICLVNASGIYTHVLQSKKSQEVHVQSIEAILLISLQCCLT